MTQEQRLKTPTAAQATRLSNESKDVPHVVKDPNYQRALTTALHVEQERRQEFAQLDSDTSSTPVDLARKKVFSTIALLAGAKLLSPQQTSELNAYFTTGEGASAPVDYLRKSASELWDKQAGDGLRWYRKQLASSPDVMISMEIANYEGLPFAVALREIAAKTSQPRSKVRAALVAAGWKPDGRRPSSN